MNCTFFISGSLQDSWGWNANWGYINPDKLGYSLFQSLFVSELQYCWLKAEKKDGVLCEVKATENDQKKVVYMHFYGMILKD